MTERHTHSLGRPTEEDSAWAKKRVSQLRELSHKVAEYGLRSMFIGAIYIGAENDLIEYSPDEFDRLPGGYRDPSKPRDARNPYCYRLKGRARSLVEQLSALGVTVRRELADPVHVVQLSLSGRPDSSVLLENMSDEVNTPGSNCQKLDQLLLIASW